MNKKKTEKKERKIRKMKERNRRLEGIFVACHLTRSKTYLVGLQTLNLQGL